MGWISPKSLATNTCCCLVEISEKGNRADVADYMGPKFTKIEDVSKK